MLRIGGIIPFSTVDWPGKLACVAFLAGCPWRCPYCQNHALWSADAATQTEEDLFALLETRRGLLDGVVFSGGEPLAQEAVVEAAAHARKLGFEVGLHTCGAYPERLHEMMPLLDWVGLDVKAPWDAYDAVTRPLRTQDIDASIPTGQSASQCLDMLISSDIDFEVRTTWHPALLTPSDIRHMGHDLARRGMRSWAIQAYRHTGTTGELPDETVYPFDVPDELPALFEHYEFRRA